MHTHRERIVMFNGVQLSNTGFKDLRFETSRFSDGLSTIRGFGSQLNESNLNVVDTISVDFVLKVDELKNLTYIYNMFKAIGILPIENEYLIEKISDSLSGGNGTASTHLLCFLERLQVTSLEKTSNGYDVNMVLTLYHNSFVGSQYKEFQEKFKKWNDDTKFSKICLGNINKHCTKLANPSKSYLGMFIYNVEKLNAYYKENILDSEKINKLLNGDSEIEASMKENKRIDLLRNKLPSSEKYKPVTIEIANKHILQIELITNNMITNFPMKGRNIGYKSFLGIGKSTFGVKMIFNESENSIVQKLKNISDKNIINHKFVINHPMVQLFDFYCSDITNITFNNLESANGIVVTMLFNISGFNYDKDENLLNSSDIILKKCNSDFFIQESIGGLYLEHLADYLMKNRKNDNLSINMLKTLVETPLETKVENVSGNDSIGKNVAYRKEVYSFIDFLSSYSSLTTSFGYHQSVDNDIRITPKFPSGDRYNALINKSEKIKEALKNKQNPVRDIFGIDCSEGPVGFNRSDGNVDRNTSGGTKDLKKAFTLYSYLDAVALYSILSSEESKKSICHLLFNSRAIFYSEYLMKNLVNPLGIELFNENQNIELPSFGVCSKFYEEFYYRLFDICLNMQTVSSRVNELRSSEVNFINSNGEINFNKIHNYIYDISITFLEGFIASFSDELFIERVMKEISCLVASSDEKYQQSQAESLKFKFKDLIIELLNEVYYQYTKNKSEIVEKIYNIFLTKLNYFLVMYIYGKNQKESSIEYEAKKLSMETQIKVFILSSCSFVPLLLKNRYRTDSFGKNITLGTQNIGAKIIEYNKILNGFNGKNEFIKDNPLAIFYKDNNKNIDEEKDKYIYQLFPTLFGEKLASSYYLSILNNSTIYGNKDKFITYDEVIKKDCLYFYGNKIPRYDIHIDLIKIVNPKENKEAFETISNFLCNAKQEFIKGEKYCELYPKELVAKQKDYAAGYGFESVNTIKRFHYADIPSFYKELFIDSTDEENLKLNNVMKSRILGHNDMFYNMDNLTKIVTDSSNTILPDYTISILKKRNSSEYAGEINTFQEEEYELFANNISSISIVKDPKTKIKTATIEIIDIKKHVFSVGEDGAFNIKEMKNGKVEVIRIETGDEIRIKLGYLAQNNVFNGAITNIQFGSNTMVLTCSSFASLMYGYNIPNIAFNTGTSFTGQIKEMAQGIIKLIDLASLKKSGVEYIYQLGQFLNNTLHPNKHLFNIFPKEYNNIVNFLKGSGESETGMFMMTSIVLRCLPKRIMKKLDGRAVNITDNKLVNSKIVVEDLKKPLGAANAKDELESSEMAGNAFKNINNVDHDYETYGINNCGEEFKINELTGEMIAKQYRDGWYESTKAFAEAANYDNFKKIVSGSGLLLTNKLLDELTEIIDNSLGDEEKTLLTKWPCSFKRITELKGVKKTAYRNHIHQGIDIGYKGLQCSIKAARKGIVDEIHDSNQGSGGRYIVIKHQIGPDAKKDIIYTFYMHLAKDSIKVEKDEIVSAGQNIATLGNSGCGNEKCYSAGHLHFEVRANDRTTRLNPLDKGVFPFYSDLRFKKGIAQGQYGQYAGKAKYVD